MNRAAIYCRVSTDEQAKHGYSIEAQLHSLRQYAKEHDYTVVDEYVDEGVSARKSYKKRPKLMLLLQAVENEKIDTILFIKLDRWFRNVQNYYEVQPLLDRHNVSWVATEEDYETVTASGRFKVNIMLSVAQDEADRTSERIRFVFDQKKSKGELVSGSVPLGLKIENKKIVIDEETVHIARAIFQNYIDTRSIKGTIVYVVNTFQRSISRDGVAGILKNPRMVEYEVVTQEQFDTVQKILKETSKKKYPKSDRVYLFSSLCVCDECKRKMRATTSNKSKVTVMYGCSRHQISGNASCSNRRCTHERDIEAYLLENIVDIAKKYNVNVSARKREASSVDPAAIKRKLEKLKDLYLNDLIDRDIYETDYKALQNQLHQYIPESDKEINIEDIETAKEVYKLLSKENKSVFWHRIIDKIYIDKDKNIRVELLMPYGAVPNGSTSYGIKEYFEKVKDGTIKND